MSVGVLQFIPNNWQILHSSACNDSMDIMPATAYSYVRFSIPQQLKGDSLRRQLEASERYVAEHGLVLDKTLNLRDLGISAFRGKNVERGGCSLRR
ncbi:hypothetical protein GHK24_12515 [Rhodocyclus tenuis]|uniref:Uncharacterized protein n=1 Tax=Rhodocyclus tenuis TaxID=1066 RepID=A0A6L5JZ23_RHOTE|nr:hypothetical protein [Rhodocyclus gracilis]